MSAPPTSDELSVHIRAYAVPHARAQKAKGPKRISAPLAASAYSLTFDTETTTDAAQTLRFGAYQFRESGMLLESGLFYDPEGVSTDELTVLRGHAEAHDLLLRTRQEFVDEVFFGLAYELRATFIGFNLPFDISRLAISHNTARTNQETDAAVMRGGFTFRLSENKNWPHIRIKHLSRKSSIIAFAAARARRETRRLQRGGFKIARRSGHFIDVATLSNALLARSFSLSSLSKFLKIKNPKLDFDEFSGPITDEMVRYAVRDVQATWECYAELRGRYDALDLDKTSPEKIYSEAGIGKAYIKQMGIRPWRECQPDFPPEMIGTILGTYFGGRSEVHIRRETTQVMLCDFLSMYPTVCTLMGLWRYVVASNIKWRDATEETRNLLDRVTLADLQSKAIWRHLTMIVRVEPDADIFPVRAQYGAGGPATIGANYLTSDQPLWFTLADCIASKLLTGKAPKIIEAIAFSPGRIQRKLSPIEIAGNPDYSVDPAKADFFKRVIELRKDVQGLMPAAAEDERECLDTEQHALKICANSTSYGIWVETNVDAPPKPRSVTVHNSVGVPFAFDADKVEQPGNYFHPLLATLITGAARLMLAISERLIRDQGLDWAFCDTDSMAIAKPQEMPADDFIERVQSVVGWFDRLNPYAFGGSILKIEEVNRAIGESRFEPLFCYAISSKRYALFNLGGDGSLVLRKVSAHGLGHLRPPYDDSNSPNGFTTPDISVLRDGAHRWHCDLWHQIILAALNGHPDRVSRHYHPALHLPAVSRYAATSPQLLAWYRPYNIDKPYRNQVKPFNFLMTLSPRRDFDASERLWEPKRGRPRKRQICKPAAPFDRDPMRAIERAFDRQTGEPVLSSALLSYADSLSQYHLSPESKFLNGDFLDRGHLKRRHVRITGVRLIGKEAHDLERQASLGFDPEAAIDYGDRNEASSQFFDLLRAYVAECGVSQGVKAMGIARSKVLILLNGDTRSMPADEVVKLHRKLSAARKNRDADDRSDRDARDDLTERVRRDGLRQTARSLSVDPSNLRRRLVRETL